MGVSRVLLAPSGAGDWVLGRGRGRREQSTCTQQLSKAGSGRGLKGRAFQPARLSPSRGS